MQIVKNYIVAEKKLRKLRDFPRNIFLPQLFLSAAISGYKVPWNYHTNRRL